MKLRSEFIHAFSFGLVLLVGVSGSAQAAAEEPELEDSTARYQSTLNWQTHPKFRSQYSDVNSLNAGHDRMFTFSATAHWGKRVWEDGEVYINPELAAGRPFSKNLIGLGGFTNGEITRAGGPTPKPYLQRLFFRQTWNQGERTEQIESDFNQMAGKVARDRFVLTAGNFSTLDVFDDNAYAKDPRSQFMNWGNWAYASFDYAADARGFGWGFAGEWYKQDWVIRFGRMTGPKEPNGLPIDFAIGKHYGDQIEIEHSHQFLEQPGKVRILGFRNRAVVANFNDARNYLLTHPGTDPQTIFKVRNGEKIKYGLGVNVEQAINDKAGFFLRAMKTDGRTETYAFTEVDDSFSSGFLFQGSLWGRAKDTIGVSLLRNGLSKDRRRYLEAGGISFFIGDGRLAYKTENIFEGFYSFGFDHGISITADYQRIANPAYNAARGPVDVYAVRFHSEF